MNEKKTIPTIGLILGGTLDSRRREDALKGRKPRVDVMEMESRYPAKLFDYQWLTQKADGESFTRILLSIAKRMGYWSEILALRVVWELRKFDAIYATGEDVGLPLAALLRILKFNRPKLVLRTEQPVFGRNQFRQYIYKRIFKFAVNRIDVIFTRTQAHAKYFEENFRLHKTKVCFSPETTDIKFFSVDTQPLDLARLDLIPKPYIVSAGLEMRDYETLIAAVENLPVHALICAGSPWAKVQFNASNGSLPDNVTIDSFSQLEMREIYRLAEFVVLPIKQTMRACGMNVILEAWGMGKAVIASKTQGLTSYIEDGINGLFVSPEDVNELRDAIMYLLNSPEKVKCVGQSGYSQVTPKLGMESYLETVKENLFEDDRFEQ